MSTPGPRPGGRRSSGAKGWIVGILVVGGLLLAQVYGEAGSFTDLFEADTAGTTRAVFGPQESGRLIERLDAAAKAQGICYGWQIDPGTFSAAPTVTPSFSDTFRPSLPSTSSPSTSEPSTSPAPAPSEPEPAPSEPPASAPTASAPTSSGPDSAVSAAPTPTSSEPIFPPSGPPITVPNLGVQTGSNLGISTDPRIAPAGACARWVVFTADYTYDSVNEEWTSVTVDVESNLARTPSPADLAGAGITSQSLLGDDATARLGDAIGALPMIVAEQGGAPAVPEATTATPPPGDRLASPGIGRYVWMGLAIIMIIGGLGWIAVAAVRSRTKPSPGEPT